MKNILAILIAFALLCSCAFAAELSGNWYADAGDGDFCVLKLEENGTYSIGFESDGEPMYYGTWEETAEGVIFDRGTDDETDYLLEDGELRMYLDGVLFTSFNRERIESEIDEFDPDAMEYEIAAPNFEATEADFDGEWVTEAVGIFDNVFDPGTIGANMTLSVSRGAVRCTYTIADTETFDLSGTAGVKDGILAYNAELDGVPLTLVMAILENGRLCVDIQSEDEDDVYFYCVKQ